MKVWHCGALQPATPNKRQSAESVAASDLKIRDHKLQCDLAPLDQLQEEYEFCAGSALRTMHLDVLLQVALEAGEHDLALAGLEAVHHGRDGTLQVGAGEQDQLLRTARVGSAVHSAHHIAWRAAEEVASLRCFYNQAVGCSKVRHYNRGSIPMVTNRQLWLLTLCRSKSYRSTFAHSLQYIQPICKTWYRSGHAARRLLGEVIVRCLHDTQSIRCLQQA